MYGPVIAPDSRYFLPYPFDRAAGLRSNDVSWEILYSNHQTKAILLKDSRIHRELNRSYYHADVYDFPIAITARRDGRVVIAHCPEEFNILELQDAETGEAIASFQGREMEFHSRLAFSPNGLHLIDAGWFWHPVNGACLFDAATLKPVTSFGFGAEIDSAVFLDDQHIVVTTTDEILNGDSAQPALGPRELGVWSIGNRDWISVVNLTEPCGTMMPWREWAISFYDHPKAIELKTGKIVHQWEHIETGKQIGPISVNDPPPPAMALDPQHGRFAVCGRHGTFVVELSAE